MDRIDARAHLGTSRVFDSDQSPSALLAAMDRHGIRASVVQPFPGAPDPAAAHDGIARLAGEHRTASSAWRPSRPARIRAPTRPRSDGAWRSSASWPSRGIPHDLVRAIRSLGAERVMFGSDLVTNPGFELAKYEAAGLTDAELETCLPGNAGRVFRLSDQPPGSQSSAVPRTNGSLST